MKAWLAAWLRELAGALDPQTDGWICCNDEYATGKAVTVSSDEPDWLVRCVRCGVPRGTLSHGLMCQPGDLQACTDPLGGACERVNAIVAAYGMKLPHDALWAAIVGKTGVAATPAAASAP